MSCDRVSLFRDGLIYRLGYLKETAYGLTGIERAMYNEESGDMGAPNGFVMGCLFQALKVIARSLDAEVETLASMAGIEGFEQ